MIWGVSLRMVLAAGRWLPLRPCIDTKMGERIMPIVSLEQELRHIYTDMWYILFLSGVNRGTKKHD